MNWRAVSERPSVISTAPDSPCSKYVFSLLFYVMMRPDVGQDVTKMHVELDKTVRELDTTKHNLAEKDRLLRTRDALLESTGLESRRLSEMLEKERQARK